MIEKLKTRWNCFKKGILNLVYYFHVIWSDRDWDWSFMMDLQKHKLDSIIKHYETNNCFVNQEIELRYMRIAKYCIENIGNVHAAEKRYINDKNFERIRDANGQSPMENGFWKSFKDKNYEYFINDVYEEKLWYLYNRIIQTRARKWWD